MEFTKQEIALLKRVTSTNRWDHWIWETAYLVPSIALIAFGALDGSERSIFVGTGVLATMRIIVVFQQSKRHPIFKGLCEKIYNSAGLANKPDTYQGKAE